MPDEGLWVAVVVFDEVIDGRFQFFGRTVDAAPELAFGEQGEPAFDQVQPTGRSWREMHMEAGTFGQPIPNQLRFMSSVVVQDEVNVQFFGHVLLDGVEKIAKLF